MKPKNKFQWLLEHQQAFELANATLTAEDGPLLCHFDPELPITLTTDASKTGFGFPLTQKDKNGNTGLIQCGSMFLTPAEKNYAVIEIEAMAVGYSKVQKLSFGD